MLNTTKTIAVIGATGRQGSSVIEALLTAGTWDIRAVVRNPGSPAGRQMAERGVAVVAGDLDDPRRLRDAFEGAYGVFSMQGTHDDGGEIEARRGARVADAAAAARVRHFVYASVGGAERHSGIPHFAAKWSIEERLHKIGLPVTVVRPVFFMENFALQSYRYVLLALMRSYLLQNKPLQMIAVADIGKWVAQAFANPEKFIGSAHEIAGDELTRQQIVAAFRRHGLRGNLPFAIPRLVLERLPGELAPMFKWFGRAGYRADIARLRAGQPDLQTLISGSPTNRPRPPDARRFPFQTLPDVQPTRSTGPRDDNDFQQRWSIKCRKHSRTRLLSLREARVASAAQPHSPLHGKAPH
ncbi:Uncharacterized conserved protein YbjT, contains NAD(P)-binding and DUF2867 domains [Devosia sp. YR412]|uniref:NmrA/HSCARG family protein n=1 Tax=Devosia sp. YR412 TaxID=1881030 RepID=UPI0008BC3EB5|nr:NmrA/HSCARG family protein [Devosia sp. YR412]SEP62029.1 Uncharacterized conserved protein YbjT, contains NAD(P)-binding and DUF2867 domains [Devosia sp. YR412]